LGLHFDASQHEEWNELEEQVDGYLKKLGSSIVGSWEVAAAELARKLVGRPDERVLIDRFSDGLVPALAPFQDLHKGISSAMAEGRKAGTAQSSLSAATRPLIVLVAGLDARAQAGWEKTTEYLVPIYGIGNTEAAREAMTTAGPRIAAACASADALLRDQLSRLPQAPSLWVGICEPFDAYQLALTRDLEMEIHAATRGMIGAIGR
jgi:hypothetical protein